MQTFVEWITTEFRMGKATSDEKQRTRRKKQQTCAVLNSESADETQRQQSMGVAELSRCEREKSLCVSHSFTFLLKIRVDKFGFFSIHILYCEFYFSSVSIFPSFSHCHHCWSTAVCLCLHIIFRFIFSFAVSLQLFAWAIPHRQQRKCKSAQNKMRKQ